MAAVIEREGERHLRNDRVDRGDSGGPVSIRKALAAALLACAPAIHCAGAPQDSRQIRAEGASGASAGSVAADSNHAAFPVPPKGMVTAKISLVNLTPAAKIQAEKFQCVCGCGLSLGECTCSKTPGSIDMKQFLQSLVDARLSPDEIRKKMVDKYGASVLR